MSVLLTVTYRITGDVQAFRVRAAHTAVKIAGSPGLRWKVWGLGPDGTGVSAYIFETAAAADAFANGPAIGALKSNPLVQSVTLASAPVDATLSQITKASFAA
jgi:hypothetical protein